MLPTTVWLIALIALVVGEAVTVGLTFIWFAVGALGALVVAGVDGAIWLQIVVFLVLSGLSLILIRPLTSRFLNSKVSPTNADRVIGQTARVTETIDNTAGAGLVNIAGQVWSARSQHDIVIPAGTEVKVLRIEGVKVYVET